MINLLEEKILLPIADMIAGISIKKKFDLLMKTQWWSLNELIEFQNNRVRYLVHHAYKNVPYYHNQWKKIGIHPDNIKTVDDLKKLPIVTKEIIKSNFQDFISLDANKRKKKLNGTGGSTGKPLQYWLDMEAWSMGWAANYRLFTYAGWKFGDKMVYFGGSSIVPADKNWKREVKNRLIDRVTPISSFDISDENLKSYYTLLTQIKKPFFLRGYASSVYLLAKFMEENNYKPPEKLRAIFTTAEKLHKFQRETIENVFGVDVYDNYGCNDGGANAGECKEHNGLHISMERAVHGVLTDDDELVYTQDATGSIVLTDLWNFAFPFINYLPEDYVTISFEKCGCGRNLPRVTDIHGRIQDFLVTPEGTKIHGEFISHIFWRVKGVKEFQVIQRKIDELGINIVPEKNFDSNQISLIKEIIKNKVPSWEVQINLVDEIKKGKNGKYKFVINEVLR